MLMEPYDATYFEQTHRNWFANPDLLLFERIARLVDREPEPRSLIDVGCGNGNFLRFLAGRSPSMAPLIGLDLRTNTPTPGIEFVRGDVLTSNLDRRFSIVVSLATIEHLSDARAFVRRLKSLARPGGLVVVMTLNDSSILYMAARMLRRFGIALPFERLYGRHHIHHFTRISLSRLLKSEELEPERVILHNAPLASLDIPLSTPAAALMARAALCILFALGSISGRTYLQTAICRRPCA
jgi:2-polyprenyl-3-methyl-5-hydroxy-6-metoxy-1,4-benzoquinol methylase